MKIRNDFVSNSSSSSFIMHENEKDDFYNHLGNNYKLFKLKTIKDELINLKAKITSAKLEFINQTGLDEDSFQKIFEATYFGLSNCLQCCDENVEDIDEWFATENDRRTDYLITEPVDRDRAYEMGYNGSVFKGDL